MICKNCGGEFSESQLICPYCGSENEVLARKQQQDYIKYYQHKTERLGEEALQEQLHKNTRRIAKSAVLAVCLFFVLLAAIWAISAARASTGLGKYEKQLARLEELYQNGEYRKMGDYLDETGQYGGRFEKYEQVQDLFWFYEFIPDCAAHDLETAEKYGVSADYIVYDLDQIFRELRKIEEIEKEGFPYHNDKALLEFKEKYLSLLRETFLLEPQDIAEGMELYTSGDTEDPDCSRLSVIAAERMNNRFYQERDNEM